MTDLSWLDAIEARQRKHGGVTASDVAGLVKALRDAHAKLARVEALAAAMENVSLPPNPNLGQIHSQHEWREHARRIRAALAEETS